MDAGASEFVAGAAFAGASVAGAASCSDPAGASEVVCRTETPPCNAGIEIKRAKTMKLEAATIVIFESTDAVPRGPNAAFEILLVKRAPASVLPGCKSTLPINTRQERKNNA